MTQQLRRFGVGQTAKVAGALYALMGLVLVPFFLLASMSFPEGMGFGMGLVLLMPILYGVFGYIFVAIGCAIYNFVAGYVGGIEVDLGESTSQ